MTSHRANPAETIPPPHTPTQVAHPWRAVLRTFVAAAVGVAVAWLVRTLGIDLTALSQQIIDSLTALAWAVGTGLVQWLLTRPGLQPVLAAVGLDTGVRAEVRDPNLRA
jgi:hypothetical protein